MNQHTVKSQDDDYIWNLVLAHAGETFTTVHGLPFTYHQKIGHTGAPVGELIIDRKMKTITRNTVLLAYQRAAALMSAEGCVRGPKKLGVFGASYLYPVFLKLGVCKAQAAPAKQPIPRGDEHERQPKSP